MTIALAYLRSLSCWACRGIPLYIQFFINDVHQLRRNDISSGIKAWPENGSGVERDGGFCKRYHMSHAVGVANCIAWQFHPRGTHRVGLFSLDFLWFFLVSRQERTCEWLFAILLYCDATIQFCSLESPSVHRYTSGSSIELQMFSPYGAGRSILEEDSSTSSEWQYPLHTYALCYAELAEASLYTFIPFTHFWLLF